MNVTQVWRRLRERHRPLHNRGDLPAAAGGLPRSRRRAGRRAARARRRAHRAGERRSPRASSRSTTTSSSRRARRGSRRTSATSSATARCTASCRSVASPRAEVANTIRYRRRKGTVSVLEQLAADVTGWPARAVEFFELLATTQYMNHVRPHAQATATCATRRASSSPERSRPARSTRSRTPPRCGGSRRAPAATTSRTSASSSGACRRCGSCALAARGRRRLRAPLPLRPARHRQAAVRAPRTEQEITHLAEPLDVPLPLLRRFAARTSPALRQRARAAARDRDRRRRRSDRRRRHPHLRPLGRPRGAGNVGARAAAGRHARRDRSRARPRRLRRGAGRRGDAARDVPLRHRRSPSAAAATTASRTLEQLDTVVPVSGGDPLGPPLTSSTGGGAVEILDSRRYAAPATITATTPAPGAPDRKVVLRSANRARPLLDARRPAQARDGSGHDCRAQRPRARRRRRS